MMLERELKKHNPTERFSNRVENYIKYRPGYPPEIVNLLRDETGLTSSSLVADIGSGTGILSKLFLENGAMVFGVEPNEAMRAAGEHFAAKSSNFLSLNGTAEATTLEKNSVDYIVAGQAFHWFDIPRAKNEFARILRAGGWVVLVWNNRKPEATPFLREYEKLLLEFSADYAQVNHRNIDAEKLSRFFAPNFKLKIFDNYQMFDYESLRGRLLSSSYAPTEDDSRYNAMLDELHKIFLEHKKDGHVKFEYDTQVYYGHIEL